MYVTRHMGPVVLEVSSQYPALLIVDPRQVGKTTMLEQLIEVEGRGRAIVTLDDLTERELAKTDSKLYFYDTGLVCYLTRWTSPETAMAGALLSIYLQRLFCYCSSG